MLADGAGAATLKNRQAPPSWRVPELSMSGAAPSTTLCKVWNYTTPALWRRVFNSIDSVPSTDDFGVHFPPGGEKKRDYFFSNSMASNKLSRLFNGVPRAGEGLSTCRKYTIASGIFWTDRGRIAPQALA